MNYFIKIFFSIILYCTFVFPQSKNLTNISNKGFFLNFLFFNDSTTYITVHFPANYLIFNKVADTYIANYSLELIFQNFKKEQILSLSKENVLHLENENYQTRNDFFVNLFFNNYNLKNAQFCKIILSQNNSSLSEIDYKITPSKFLVGKLSDSLFILSNLGNLIPFSANSYDLLLDATFFSDTLTLQQGNKLITFNNLPIIYLYNQINEKNKSLIIQTNQQSNNRYYLIKNFNQLFFEGVVNIKDQKNNSTNINVFWYNKPLSLKNISFAIEKLSLLFNKDDIDKLIKSDSIKYSFFQAWKKYDNDTNTSFNPMLEEFYRRVDFSIKNFSTLSVKDGSETDMGKIYILYGPPTNKERILLTNKKTIEIWKYNNIKKSFTFEDNSGLGNFKLVTK
ncbi:MAG TPA: GWxTD domain-containing protein [Ignavibacteriales bacterium]|nr:GWxTD domain-containing protein [Ignavibacteriales bacterium]HOL82225.1 GWxTD domain-containing protein [Ignavibacteriales bacterium]